MWDLQRWIAEDRPLRNTDTKKNKGNKRSADLPVSGDTDAAGGNSNRNHEI